MSNFVYSYRTKISIGLLPEQLTGSCDSKIGSRGSGET